LSNAPQAARPCPEAPCGAVKGPLNRAAGAAQSILARMMLPHECPPNQIFLEQVATTWKVVRRNESIEDFDTFREAIAFAAEQVKSLIRDGHREIVAIVVQPPASPWMRE
jgi:hypothetical protein